MSLKLGRHFIQYKTKPGKNCAYCEEELEVGKLVHMAQFKRKKGYHGLYFHLSDSELDCYDLWGKRKTIQRVEQGFSKRVAGPGRNRLAITDEERKRRGELAKKRHYYVKKLLATTDISFVGYYYRMLLAIKEESGHQLRQTTTDKIALHLNRVGFKTTLDGWKDKPLEDLDFDLPKRGRPRKQPSGGIDKVG